jgi:shikimate kinase
VRHVVLVGPMGSGKTTVGRLLATRLGLPFRDSDQALRSVAGQTAAELADTAGTETLHAREADILRAQLAEPGPSVIAAAGSVVDDAESVARLGDPLVRVVWLHAPIDLLVERARGGAHRPWHGLDPRSWLEERAVVRDPVYARLADIDLDVGTIDPDAAVAAIVADLDLAPDD